MYPGSTSEQPPYGAPPPRKKPPVLLFVVLGCGGCFLLSIPILAAILFPVFAQARMKARAVSCLSNVKMQSLGMMMYVQDYDENFPPAKTWMDNIDSYVKMPTAFHCTEIVHKNPEESNYGYAFDSRLSKISLSKIGDPRNTLMIYDSTTLTRNATDAGKSVDQERHGHSPNAGYADGHAKRLLSDSIDPNSP